MRPEAACNQCISRPSKNCWRMSKADRVAFLIDGKAYFDALASTLPGAVNRIWILGWDFDPDIQLQPELTDSPTLGDFLHQLVSDRPQLEVYILVWALGPIYSSGSTELFRHHPWADHPRIFLRFDARHPLRGAHHQKIVCVDDHIAFVGGIDLTSERWDSRKHDVTDPLRKSPKGESYGPVHDLQMMLSGPVARHVGELASARWKRATGQTVAPVVGDAVPWPAEITPELEGCHAAIARTIPKLLGKAGRHEAIQLTLDALHAARRHIYIETQYLASFRVARALGRRLREANGPEVLIVVTKNSRGALEQLVMANNRDRLIRRLKEQDTYDRLRVVYAIVPDGQTANAEVLVHSKVLVVDDVFARVGSSNLNNRSEGLDTECDIAIEPATTDHRKALESFRNSLLAEHLQCDPGALGREIAARGSLIGAIDRFNIGARGLRSYDIDSTSGKISPLPGTGLLDPAEPFQPLQRIGRSLARGANKLLGRCR